MTRWVHPLLIVTLASTACVADYTAHDTAEADLALGASCPPDALGCLPGRLVDTSPAPGLQPDCAVTLDLDDGLEYAVPPCSLSGGTTPCFEPVLDRDACPYTPSGLRMEVRHDLGDAVIATVIQCAQRSRR